MFSSSPRYSTLTRQVANALEEEIRGGKFKDNLPGERWLAESMQVSRRTLRAALELLRQKKVLHPKAKRQHRILNVPAGSASRPSLRSIGLLLPEPLADMPPYSAVFFDPLRALLYADGFRLENHIGHSFFSRRPAAALERLIAAFPCDGWVMPYSSRASQTWFHARRIPVVIVGSAHEGIDVPYVDVDYRATARHAAGYLIGKGHRRLGLIVHEDHPAGDKRTEAGFVEGSRSFAGAGASTMVFRHGGTMADLRRMTERILRLAEPPTALLIANPYSYMGVAGLLAEHGVKVPRDLSLLCRDNDYCLRYMPIEPSRYVCSPEKRARAIYSTLMRALQPGASDAQAASVLLMPDLVEGGSVARITAATQ